MKDEATTDTPEDVGIRCKKCGEKMRVWKTCADVNVIQRIRKCDKCVIYRVTYER